MGRRAGRKRPTRRQKIAMADTRRVTNPDPCPRLVACGVRRAGRGMVVAVDFGHFGRQHEISRYARNDRNDGPSTGGGRGMGEPGACEIRSHGDVQPCHTGMHSHAQRGNEGGVPDLERMSDLGRGVVIALAGRMGCSPSEVIERAKG